MDQSASVFGQRGSALYVSFKPTLVATAVPVPVTKPEVTFVVAQSFVAADKHVTAPVCYNLRVVECSFAAIFLARIFQLKDLQTDSGPLGVSLRGFHDAYFEHHEGIPDNSKTTIAEFQIQLEKLSQLVEDYLHQEEGYTREQIADVLGISVDDLHKRFEAKCPVRAERFMLRQRALHVFREAIRVIKFKALLSSPSSDGDNLPKLLGDLMNETQDSCRDIYECSCK
jgi:galactokinase